MPLQVSYTKKIKQLHFRTPKGYICFTAYTTQYTNRTANVNSFVKRKLKKSKKLLKHKQNVFVNEA